MVELYVIRHAESTINKKGVYIGGQALEALITEEGEQQCSKLGKRLHKQNIQFDEVHSSDAIRAYHTATLTCPYINFPIEEIKQHAALRERDQDDWVGRIRKETYTDYVKKQMLKHPLQFRPPNGESPIEVGERMYQYINKVIQKNTDEYIAIFTHGFATKCLLQKIMQFNPQLIWKVHTANTSITRLRHDTEGWHVLTINDKSHLT